MTGLQKQIINLSFSQGVDTKTDAYQVPLGKLLLLQNATFVSPGMIKKRNGYTQMTQSILGGGSVTSPVAAFGRGNELCAVAGSIFPTGPVAVYSYDSANTAWVNKGNCNSLTTTLGPLATTQYSMNAIDMAQTSGGLQCFVYELSDQNNVTAGSRKQGLGYTIIDSTTGQVVVPPTTLDNTATSVSPHVIILGSSFCVYYIQGDLAATADIFVKTISTTTPNSAASAAVKVTSGTTTSTLKIAANAYNFDAVADATNATGYISFNNRSDGTTVFRVLSATPSTVTSSIVINTTNSRTSTVFMDLNGNVALAYLTAAAVTGAVFSSDLSTTVKAATTIDNALATYTSVTGTCTTSGNLTFFIGCGTGIFSDIQTRINTFGGSTYGTVGTVAYLIRSLQPGAKAFTYNSTAYVPLWYCGGGANSTNTAQNTLFLVDSSGHTVGRALGGVTGGWATITSSASTQGPSIFYQLGATTLSSTTATLPASASLQFSEILRRGGQTLWAGLTGAVTTTMNFQYGARAVSFNFNDSTNNYQRGTLANAVHLSGGILQMYDGASVVEHGFLISPESISLTAFGSLGNLSAGTYSYIVIYSWMDAQGQIHVSMPSAPFSVTTVSTDKVTVRVPTLRVTAKSGVTIDVYRTLVNATTYHKVSNFNQAGSFFNDTTVDTVSFVDTQSDTSISAAPQPYTSGGVLVDAPCAPAGPLCVHRNRLFVVDSTNPTQIWYSKQVSNNAPVEFSGFQILNIDPKGGAVTALASMDDKLIVFKSDRMFMVLGQGPDALGSQNDFTDAILVSADTGCTAPKTVVLTPDGLMYQSPKGIYQLSRALQVSYIGAPVEGLVSGQTLGGALTLPDRNQVWFSVNSGSYSALVYDYLVGQWSSFLSGVTLNAFDVVSWQGQVVLCSSAALWKETIGTYADPSGQFIAMLAQTSWIKMAGLQGFQRAWRAIVLGAYKSRHVLNVLMVYDYKAAASYAQSASFTVTSDTAPYQYRIHLAQQKCEAIQFIIGDAISGGVTGESLSLSGLALEVGLKKGGRKLPAAQSA